MKTITSCLSLKTTLGLLAIGAFVLSAQARVLVPTNSTWRYFKGISEASTPTNAWRELDFDDSAWLTGLAPFHFGTNAAGGDDGQMGGTILDDMRGNYTCVFLRQQFVIDDTNQLQGLWLTAWYDDGFAVWINGQPPRNSVGMAGNGLAYTNVASGTTREANTRTRIDISSAFGLLRTGTNVLGLQAFNGHLTNDDFRIEVELAEATPTLNFAVASITVAENRRTGAPSSAPHGRPGCGDRGFCHDQRHGRGRAGLPGDERNPDLCPRTERASDCGAHPE